MSSPMGRTLRAGEIPLTVVQCVHAAECAGCPLIHLDYAQQLTSKRARVVTAMSHYPSLELLYTRPVQPAEPMVGYRGRAKLIVSPEGRIGLYARSGNHEVVDIPSCKVLTPALAEVAAAVRDLCANPPDAARGLLLPYNPFGGGVLRALDLREVRLPPPGAPASSRDSFPGPASGPAARAPFAMDPPRPPPPPAGSDPLPDGSRASEPLRDSPIPRAPSSTGAPGSKPPGSGRPDVIKRPARDTRRAGRASEPAIDVLRWARGGDDREPRSDSSPPSDIGRPPSVEAARAALAQPVDAPPRRSARSSASACW